MVKQAFEFPIQIWMNLPQWKKYNHPNAICWYTINVVYKDKQYTDDNFTSYSCSEKQYEYIKIRTIYKQNRILNFCNNNNYNGMGKIIFLIHTHKISTAKGNLVLQFMAS